MDLNSLFLDLGISLGLGLLVGLQRERAESQLAGIRTFPLITVLGTLSAILAQEYGGWILAAGFVGLAVLVTSANRAKLEAGRVDPGMTTEVAILLMFALGAYIVSGFLPLAVALGGAVMLLLHLKEPIHQAVRRFGPKDLHAVAQLVLVSLVILPVLPNRAYGPFSVLNPREIWLMVVLISMISLAGYVAYKLLGDRTGTLVAGLLGGAISSTATTVSFARRTRETPSAAAVATVVILIAAVVSFARVIVEVAVVAPRSLLIIGLPIGVVLLWIAVLGGIAWLLGRKAHVEIQEPKNPTELKSALIFGLLYAIIIFGVAATKHYLGDRGLYIAAIVSGLTDMDAITLSTAQLVNSDRLSPTLGWRIILIAAMANTVFKGVLVFALGDLRLAGRIALFFGAALAGAAVLLWLWPDERVAQWLTSIVPTTMPARQPSTQL